ncbi:ABC transporter family protein [Suhomyces tanzawaensis NRRL Y-17324]|uniref:ABC transporter family protein n=1 Tax=Suhomyces tanzawaensis NRRL Y-17324 TaxID=984487 RepID=A0A1E4SDD7_9ASCO|nr:ABC transporter family protein [Suhomyces tanzawaensis NRRL Y-17324]ODV77493.1 ABC transporter family protein [Suhomyces tanzawaensis NRRL Y-17324]
MDSQVLLIPPQERVSLAVRNLTVTVKKRSKSHPELDRHNILENVSFDLNQGEMLAIMGGSGSGKTTLLNALSTRLGFHNKTLQFEGSIAYSTEADLPRIKNSYLLQTDIFLPGLSVFETLKYQADLRMPPLVSKFEKVDLIDLLLDTLELTHLRNDKVTSFTNKINLSGGEQRRLSLAIQLLNKPSLLFLDEPTTGLDASSSLKLVSVLKKLTGPNYGLTVILSIHQPRLEISNLFDKICLLTRGGRVVYYGSLANSFSYFNSLSFLNNSEFNNKESSNFIDFIMDLSVKDTSSRAKEQYSIQRIDHLVENWKKVFQIDFKLLSPSETKESYNKLNKILSKSTKDRILFFREVVVLTKRTFILTSRDRLSLLALNGGSVFMACACGWLFLNPKGDLAGIRTTQSSLYAMMEIIGFAPMFIEIERLWANDGLNFFREYKENYVSITGFIISRRLGKILLEDFPVGALFAIITYFMWGLRGGVGHFFIYFAIVVLTTFMGMATAMVCFGIGTDLAISSLYLNIFYQLQNSACGFFVNAKTLPVYVRWIKYIAYFWYTFGALNSNQFSNWNGTCTYDNALQCAQFTGNYQLDLLGYPVNWVGEPIGILCAWLGGFYIISYFGLYFKNYDLEMSKTKQNRIGDEEEEDEEESSADNSVGISLRNVNLSVLFKSQFWKPRQEKVILEDISAEFAGNSINAIMGPSGSGKTTLLNYISRRLSGGSKFNKSGEILLNEHQPISSHELAKISSYVSQHDNSLIANLTVRETLYFQAKLRLPPEDLPRITTIVNTLIRKIGLMDCADTVIGSEYVKGVSGGEQRRVSIAIQLLSKPKILFLDEPTSGLDSSTALSILNLLKKLSKTNNTTIVLTIHQPNEDMTKIFENVLLLGKGGRVVYNGTNREMKNYFHEINYDIPDGVNITNYILDLISRGVEEDKETTDLRIDGLVNEWRSKTERSPKGLEFPVSNSDIIDTKLFHKRRSSFHVTLTTIIRRQFLNSIRSADILFAKMFQTILLAIVHTLFFARLKDNQQGITNRLGLVQEVLNLYFVGLINNISLYPIERNIFYQEYKDGVYGVAEFNLSYLINELPIEIAPCLLFSALIVFAVGLPATAGMFFTMFLSCFAAINCGESLGIIMNSVFDHLGLATNIMSNITILAIFMGGTMALNMPHFFKAWNWINPMKYAVGICAKLGFSGTSYRCTEGVECSLTSGQKVLETYSLDIDLGVYFGALAACVIVYRCVGFASVYLKIRYMSSN